MSLPLPGPELNVLDRHVWFADRLAAAGITFDPSLDEREMAQLYHNAYATNGNGHHDEEIDLSLFEPNPFHATTFPEPSRSTWVPINLLEVETDGPPQPTLSGLGYAGTLTLVYAEPEALKSWLEAIVCLEALRAGRTVIWVDFEMNAPTTIDRLRALGATNAEIQRFTYLQPSDSLTDPATRASVEAMVEELDPVLVVIDAMAGILALHGLSQNDADDIEKLYTIILRPFRTPRTAVRIIDHVVKDKESQGRWPTGSQRKLGGADVGLRLELVKSLSRGGTGLARIRVTKDRPGGLARPYVADLNLKSDPIDGAVTWTISPTTGTTGEQQDEGENWKPTWYMEQVSRVLEAHPEPMSRGDIVQAVNRKRERVLDGINHLLIDGNASETIGARGAKLVSLVQSFRVPDPFPPVPGTGGVTRSQPFPPPLGGNGSGNADRERRKPPAVPNHNDPETQRLIDTYVVANPDDDIPF